MVRALHEGSLRSARAVLSLAFEHLPHHSVVDVGCGWGEWLWAARELGAEQILGIDGDYISRRELMIEDFVPFDLSQPFSRPDRFTLALSMEVAEHLPESSADQFIASLTALAPTVLFSAAVPRQTGTDHVNEQWPDYWAQKFAQHGFACYDPLRLTIWMNQAIEPWYRQNVMVYSKQPIPAWEAHRIEHPLPLVHPDLYQAPSFLSAVKSLPKLLRQAIRTTLSKRSKLRHYPPND